MPNHSPPSRPALVAALAALALSVPASRASAPPAPRLEVAVDYYRLPNGLRVVLSQDASVPTVTVAMYYHIGFRIEPRNRTGFAHLFEHLMFQETTNLAKGEADRLVSGNGGVSNGSTRFDYTNFFEVVPSHVLEPVLWVEAERMRGLALSETSLQNQKDVVKNEVRVNVLNRPYGGFPWLDLPQAANRNWFNAHNFYGDFADIDAATLADVRSFYDTYYVPSWSWPATSTRRPRAPRSSATSGRCRRARRRRPSTSASRRRRRSAARGAPTRSRPGRRSRSATTSRRATRLPGTRSG